eukprot:2667973-Prymnesium_polylepis.1
MTVKAMAKPMNAVSTMKRKSTRFPRWDSWAFGLIKSSLKAVEVDGAGAALEVVGVDSSGGLGAVSLWLQPARLPRCEPPATPVNVLHSGSQVTRSY